jgi:hypothetical protein
LKKLLSILLVAAFLVGAFFGWRAYNSEEKKIIRQLKKIPELLTWNAKEGNLVRLGRANTLKAMLTPDVTMEVNVGRREVRSIEGNDQIFQGLMGAQAAGMILKVEIPAIKVTSVTESDAAAELTAFLYVGNENTEPFLQEVALTLKKIEDVWRISRVQTIRTLSN